jgi:hypothetical protein
MTANLSYPVSRLSACLAEHQREQLRLRDDITGPLIDWLHKRSAELQRNEDASGEWGDTATSMHVRALKGARMDCDDIRKEIESVLSV